MSTLASAPGFRSLRPWRWTVSRYERAAALGWFRNQRVELIDGKVLTMPPQLEPHVSAILKARAALERAFGAGYTVRVQAPVELSQWSKPEPDLAVVPGDADYYVVHGPPTSALLMVEVSDTTLIPDQTVKAPLYAKHSIQDYWIINLVQRRLEVHRQPRSDQVGRKRQFTYADVTLLGLDELVAPLALPGVRIAVKDMFPVVPPTKN